MKSLPYTRLSLLAAAAMFSASAHAAVDFNTCAKPKYPKESLRYEQTGTVTLAFQIGADGKPTASRVEKSSGHPLLDAAAREGLEKCTFKLGADPAAWTKIQYVWTLEGPTRNDNATLQADISGAARGEADAMYRLSGRHMRGTGVKRDVAEARRLLEAAAGLGHLKAIEAMAGALMHGAFGTSDLPQAETWLRKAAEAGSAYGQAWLGAMLIKAAKPAGAGEEGMMWLRRASAQGDALGEAMLGAALYARGTPAEKAEGIEWLTKAAGQDNRDAQYILGRVYLSGDGVAQDYAKAASLFAMPAAAGHRDARVTLEQMYEKGQAVRPLPPGAKAPAGSANQ